MVDTITAQDVIVPAHCQDSDAYIDNFLRATQHTGNLMLFAGDQKIEHLNEDFYGQQVAGDDATPNHLFRIAQEAQVGVFAAQHGMISRYAKQYPSVRYLVKMNSKTNLVPTKQRDPVSKSLVDFSEVLALKESGVDIVGIGYTIYLGSEFEHEMLAEAGRLISQAHKHGLLAVLWMYPRGQAVVDETHPDLVAGACGVACSLGADFVKVSAPRTTEKGMQASFLTQAVKAAGNTGVITSGGSSVDPEAFLKRTHQQIHEGGTRGSATGRNVHQRPFRQAVGMCNALKAIVVEGADVTHAIDTYKNAE